MFMRAGKLEGTESLSVASDLKSEAAKLSNGGKPRQRIDRTNPYTAFSLLGHHSSGTSAAIKS